MPEPSVCAFVLLDADESIRNSQLRSVSDQTVRASQIVPIWIHQDRAAPAVSQTSMPVLVADAGFEEAVNAAARAATSDLLAVLEPGFEWPSTHLEQLRAPFRSAQRVPLGLSYSDVDLVTTQGVPLAFRFLSAEGQTGPRRSVQEFLQPRMEIHLGSSMILRDAFLKVGGLASILQRRAKDDLFVRLFLAGYANSFVGSTSVRHRVPVADRTPDQCIADAIAAIDLVRNVVPALEQRPQYDSTAIGRMILTMTGPQIIEALREAFRQNDRPSVLRILDAIEAFSPYLRPSARRYAAYILPILRSSHATAFSGYCMKVLDRWVLRPR